jgi:hypothetical protein
MYNFVDCLQFNIRYGKVERPGPVGGALVIIISCLLLGIIFAGTDYYFIVVWQNSF